MNSAVMPLVCIISLSTSSLSPAYAADARPNVLFIIADDASRHFGNAYNCDWVKTPNIDRLASEGLVFDNAYVPTSKCAPCRAATLTGRNPWQNGQAANHQNYFPAELRAFGEALQRSGVYTGSIGKVWGPGIANEKDGTKRDFGLPPVSKGNKVKARTTFASFLDQRPADASFFYWHGSSDPHRGYKAGAGRAAGKKPEDIDHVPAYWPDNDTVRNDMLDYAIEVERFDGHVGEILKELEEKGLVDNTLVIVTSDHGMPFPRVKGHTYDDAHRVPLVMRWPKGIAKPGRRVTDLVSFIDFAPTFLQLAGISPADSGMNLTGQSLVDLLKGPSEPFRPYLLIGRERNDVFARPGSEYGLGYPTRAIRSGDFLYIRNFEPDRWPCGNPELGLRDTDGSPTKSLINSLGTDNVYWQHAFGKRPAEQLFNVADDPDCVKNLIADASQAKTAAQLRDNLMAKLKRQNDPRVVSDGDQFDRYPSVKKPVPNWEKGAGARNKKKSSGAK